MLTRLWRHKFRKLSDLSNQAVFSTCPKSQDKKMNILRTKRAFKVKRKAFFIIFEGLSLKWINFSFRSWESDFKDFRGGDQAGLQVFGSYQYFWEYNLQYFAWNNEKLPIRLCQDQLIWIKKKNMSNCAKNNFFTVNSREKTEGIYF